MSLPLLDVRIRRIGRLVFVWLLIINTVGCSWLVASATGGLAENISRSILNHNDPETVAEALPAYLLLLDGLLINDSGNPGLHAASAKLYAAYAESLTEHPVRRERLTEKGLDHAFKAACYENSRFCEIEGMSFASFSEIVGSAAPEDVPFLFLAGSSWASWIQARKNDWNAVAKLAFVERLMTRVTELDETYQQGGAHLYLGVLGTLLPETLGGKPEQGRRHFERALELSEGKNLIVKVLLAKHYARLVYDRELHDRLLSEVLAADPKQEDLTLINTIAQKQAQVLLDSADDFF